MRGHVTNRLVQNNAGDGDGLRVVKNDIWDIIRGVYYNKYINILFTGC